MIDLAWLVSGLGVAGWGARHLFHHAILRGLRAPREAHRLPLDRRSLPGACVQALRLPGAGGKTLAAWLVQPDSTDAAGPAHPPGPDAQRPAVLVMHGWGSNASMMWPVVPPLLAAGMAVLLLDARCHGLSDDEPFTSMPRFAEDIAAGLRWLAVQPGIDAQRIALLGHSVGAAAALLHAAESAAGNERAALGAGPPVRAVVSLSAFAHPEEVMRRFLAEYRVPYPLLGWAVLRHVQGVIGARFEAIAPLRTIGQLSVPVLLVHGRDDRTVPFDDALRLQRAARQAQLLGVAGGHDLREALAPHAPLLVDFLRRQLLPPANEPPARPQT